MAKNRKYILGSGIAMNPEKDMALFKDMSKQGWHFSGTMLSWYRFEKGEPANYDYASNMEFKVTEDMLSMYQESGWTAVVSCDGFQIFRAEAGAVPIFSDLESEIEALKEIRWHNIKSAGVWGMILVATRLAEFLISDLSNVIWLLLLGLFMFSGAIFIFQTVSAVGICRLIWAKKRQCRE